MNYCPRLLRKDHWKCEITGLSCNGFEKAYDMCGIYSKRREVMNKTTKFRSSLHDVHACEQLMHALNEVDVNVAQFWLDPVKTMLSYFELPNEHCTECHKEMPFFDYHTKQGMCDKCASETYKGDDYNENKAM
jgi:hypothetical protein